MLSRFLVVPSNHSEVCYLISEYGQEEVSIQTSESERFIDFGYILTYTNVGMYSPVGFDRA